MAELASARQHPGKTGGTGRPSWSARWRANQMAQVRHCSAPFPTGAGGARWRDLERTTPGTPGGGTASSPSEFKNKNQRRKILGHISNTPALPPTKFHSGHQVTIDGPLDPTQNTPPNSNTRHMPYATKRARKHLSTARSLFRSVVACLLCVFVVVWVRAGCVVYVGRARRGITAALSSRGFCTRHESRHGSSR